MKIERKPFEYGVGALAILAVSIGLAAILYGTGTIAFDLYYVPAWIFGPLGAYTVAYSAISKDPTYYLVWGTVMLAVAAVSAFYTVSIFAVIGVLLIVLAVIGIVAYWRSKRK
jgi:hypothetical protein